MAVLDSGHLLDQAERLIGPTRSGRPRQVDIRRSISAAYYAVFHKLLTAAADEFAGINRRSGAEYALIYRGVDHRRARDLCIEALKSGASGRYRPYLPRDRLGDDMLAFAQALTDLQQERHSADYDPLLTVTVTDARLAIDTARRAIGQWQRAPAEQRRLFVTLLCFPPR